MNDEFISVDSGIVLQKVQFYVQMGSLCVLKGLFALNETMIVI